jgi:peptide/nickel transport system substrate-binding protein
MRKLFKWLPFAIAVVLVFTSTGVNLKAQESGGIIIEGNAGGDPKNLNPIIGNDTSSARIFNLLFPGLVGVDPKTANFAPGAPGGLAESWDISKDGKTYTFHLKKNYKWTDGTPLTAKDFQYAFDAVVSGKVDSPYTGDAKERFESYKALDDYTLEVKFKEQSCTSLSDASFPPLPAHIFKPDFSDINDSPYNTAPNVSASVFKFKDFRPAEQVALVANQDYPEAIGGKVVPEGFIYKSVPDQIVLVEQFLAGETNVIDTPQVSRRADIRKAADAGKVKVFSFPGNAWDYVGWNLADPGNPQNGLDKNGKLIDQGHHPLFGDVRVRRAMALATNVDQIIKTAVFNEGTRLAAGTLPASWAYDPSLKPLPYDPEAAKKLLDEAGFPVGADGIRAAKGAKYAKDGTPFRFTLYTNEGNSRRKAIGTIMQDNLKQIGVQVDFQTIDFNTLLDKMNSQEFDAFILGWRNAFPDDPDITAKLFVPENDIVGSGNNTDSYNNPELTKLQKQALQLPGCDPKQRAEIYHKIDKILQDDQPYMFLFVQNGMYAAGANVEGFDPLPSQLYWNVETWRVHSK